ncbi:MAG: hypothetical protein OEL55_06485 [Desulfobulbaceae bacterium]|nr:hypothetical protein [Desulfobulbaceae bacterium]
MNTYKMLLPILFTILLTSIGCSGVQQPSLDASATNIQQENSKNKGELERLIDRVVADAKSAMRSRKATLNDVTVEATPMWSLNYKGEIHVRVYDTAGHKILDEYRK